MGHIHQDLKALTNEGEHLVHWMEKCRKAGLEVDCTGDCMDVLELPWLRCECPPMLVPTWQRMFALGSVYCRAVP